MNQNQVADVLQDLRTTTRHLDPDGKTTRFDLDRVEKAVTNREHSVARLRDLAVHEPDAFTIDDVEELHRILAEGKRAFENLLDIRRQGWTTATELRKKDFVLKTFMRFGSAASD